jgi:hypothetical protein
MLSRPVKLSARALSALIRSQCKAEPHAVVESETDWPDGPDDSGMWRECDQLGWLNRHGRLDVDVVDTLWTLVRPTQEYFGWFQFGTRRIAVLVGVLGSRGVLAYRENDDVSLYTLHPGESPVHALIREIPDHPPAYIDAFSVRVADLDPDRWHGISKQTRHDRHLVAGLQAEPTVGEGELHASIRDSTYRCVAIAEPVRYVDLMRGRIMLVTAHGHLSVAAGTKTLLASRLTEAVRTLTD